MNLKAYSRKRWLAYADSFDRFRFEEWLERRWPKNLMEYLGYENVERAQQK